MARHLRTAGWVVGVVLLAAPVIGAQGQPPVSGQRQTPCEVSTDPEFALTPQKAARVGGGAAYVAAREQRYLQALRGPAGEPVSFKRLGQAGVRGKDDTILDHWVVTYAGLEKPISVYLDAYHYGDPRAPVGFTCVGFQQLGPPPVDPFLGGDLQNRLAIEQGSKREFAPIPLGSDGSTTHGVAYDRFRLVASAALAAARAGSPWNPKDPPPGPGATLTIVAYSLKCADRTVVPQTIDVVPPQGPPVQRRVGPLAGVELARLLPSLSLPEGSVGASFGLTALRAQDTVRITYADAICDGAAKEVLLPVVFTPARGVTMPEAAKPANATDPVEPVWLQAVVDVDGLLQQAAYIGGPDALLPDAIAALAQWRAEPARMNRAPVVADTLALIRFK